MQELLVLQNKTEKQIAYIEDGILKEYYKEKEENKRLEGNIYIGKVEDILPGMQAAFVNIGEEKNSFLHIRDILPKKSNLIGNKEEDLEKYKIKDYIKPNQMLLVQVKKDATSIKGARISTNIQMPGRFVVILPENDFVTISQKIENEEEKKRLINIVERIKKGRKLGIIIRTAAENIKEDILKSDIEKTIKNLENLYKEFEEKKKDNEPTILRKSDTILEKLLLDLSDNYLDKILVNSKNLKSKIEDILSKIELDKEILVEYQEKDLENKYEIDKQIEKLENKKIWLNCGGFITIDKTEALTAIDVNSRKIYRKRRFRKNSFKSK